MTTVNYNYMAEMVSIKALDLLLEAKFGTRKWDSYGVGPEKHQQTEPKPGYYPYIALYPMQFISLINRAIQLRNESKIAEVTRKPSGLTKFIDVGCGIGDKVYIAREILQLDASGIEYIPETAAKARAVMPDAKIHEGDAFDFDFGEYDLIYMYRPICDVKLYRQLYMHIAQTARIGAVIVEALCDNPELEKPTAIPDGYFDIYQFGPHPSYSNEICFKLNSGLLRMRT